MFPVSEAVIASHHTSLVQPGQGELFVRNRLDAGGRVGALFCHGLGFTGELSWNPFFPAQRALIRRVAKRCALVASDLGGASTWGNALSVDRARQVVDPGGTLELFADAATGPKGLVGVSMGGGVAVNTIADGADIAWGVLVIPGLDQQYLRDQDTVEGISGLNASISTAHGVATNAPLPAGADPIDNAVACGHVPLLIAHSSDDDISHGVADFAAAHGNTTLVDLGALGHSEDAVAALDLDLVEAFIVEHNR